MSGGTPPHDAPHAGGPPPREPPFPFVREVVRRGQLESTNDLAREILGRREPLLPMLVWADHQTRGRGRGRNTWWSDRGSLTFTLAFDPRDAGLRPEQEPRVALAAAVAVIDAAGGPAGAVPLGIRWPNDVECGGRKLGGILAERIETDHGPRLLVGVGLNVTTSLADAPPEVRRMATSLAEIGAEDAGPPSAETLLRAILGAFQAVLPRLARDDPSLAARWQTLDTLRGEAVRVDLGPRVIAGVALGIDEEGALRVATPEGEVRIVGGQVLRDAPG